jgi:hypothetical protein
MTFWRDMARIFRVQYNGDADSDVSRNVVRVLQDRIASNPKR